MPGTAEHESVMPPPKGKNPTPSVETAADGSGQEVRQSPDGLYGPASHPGRNEDSDRAGSHVGDQIGVEEEEREEIIDLVGDEESQLDVTMESAAPYVPTPIKERPKQRGTGRQETMMELKERMNSSPPRIDYLSTPWVELEKLMQHNDVMAHFRVSLERDLSEPSNPKLSSLADTQHIINSICAMFVSAGFWPQVERRERLAYMSRRTLWYAGNAAYRLLCATVANGSGDFAQRTAHGYSRAETGRLVEEIFGMTAEEVRNLKEKVILQQGMVKALERQLDLVTPTLGFQAISVEDIPDGSGMQAVPVDRLFGGEPSSDGLHGRPPSQAIRAGNHAKHKPSRDGLREDLRDGLSTQAIQSPMRGIQLAFGEDDSGGSGVSPIRNNGSPRNVKLDWSLRGEDVKAEEIKYRVKAQARDLDELSYFYDFKDETLGAVASTRIRQSALVEIKEFGGHKLDEVKAKQWISKVASAFRRDQLSDAEKCMTFPDFLTGAVLNWHKTLPRKVRTDWNLLREAFRKEFCGESVPPAQKYYSMSRKGNGEPIEYLYRLNVQAIKAGIDYTESDGVHHVQYFIATCEDEELSSRLVMLRLRDEESLREVLKDIRTMGLHKKKTGTEPKVKLARRETAKWVNVVGNAAKFKRTAYEDPDGLQAVPPDEPSDVENEPSDVEADYSSRRKASMPAANDIADALVKIIAAVKASGGTERPTQDRKPCGLCESTQHGDADCWKGMICQICGRRGHPTDRCYQLCKACGKHHDRGECPLEEAVNQLRGDRGVKGNTESDETAYEISTLTARNVVTARTAHGMVRTAHEIVGTAHESARISRVNPSPRMNSSASKEFERHKVIQRLTLKPGERRGYWRYYPEKVIRQTIVRAKVNDTRAKILLDSGAEVSILDSTFAREVGIEVETSKALRCEGVGGSVFRVEGKAEVKITLGEELAYVFEVWVGKLGNLNVLLGSDFMTPAGVRLDLADGSACLPDDVKLRFEGRRTLYSENARTVRLKEDVALKPGESFDVPLKLEGRRRLWLRGGECFAVTAHGLTAPSDKAIRMAHEPSREKSGGRLEHGAILGEDQLAKSRQLSLRVTNISERTVCVAGNTEIAMWLSPNSAPRRQRFVSLGSRRYQEWVTLSYEAASEDIMVDRERRAIDAFNAGLPPAVGRPIYATPTKILRRGHKPSEMEVCIGCQGKASGDKPSKPSEAVDETDSRDGLHAAGADKPSRLMTHGGLGVEGVVKFFTKPSDADGDDSLPLARIMAVERAENLKVDQSGMEEAVYIHEAADLNEEDIESRDAYSEQFASSQEEDGFVPGAQVWLYVNKVKPGYAKKLAHLWHGPFRIARRIDDHMVELETNNTDCRIFPMVHISRRKLRRRFGVRPTVELVASHTDEAKTQAVREVEQAVLPGERAIGGEGQAVTGGDQAIRGKRQAVPGETQAIPTPEQAVRSDGQAVTDGTQAVRGEVSSGSVIRFDFDEALLPEDSWEPDQTEGVYEVEAIVDKRRRKPTRYGRRITEYLVKWKGYETSDWVPEENLNCGGLIADFEERVTARGRYNVMQSADDQADGE